MKQEPIYVGIDVSKSRLDVGVRPGGDSWSIAYDEAGIRDLASRLQSLEPAAVLLEATGRLAKTDALDAQVLAHFAQAVRPPVRPLRAQIPRSSC